MITILCFVEQYNEAVKQWISQYDDDRHIIQLYGDVVNSSEGNLFFCMGEIATQLFAAQGEVWFVTDHNDIAHWIHAYYSMYFSKIEYIERKTCMPFQMKPDIVELLQYEGSIKSEGKEQSYFNRLLFFAKMQDYPKLLEFSISLAEWITQCPDVRFWQHACTMLLDFGKEENSLYWQYYRTFLLSVLSCLQKDPYRLNRYLESVLANQCFDSFARYYTWNQVKAYRLRQLLTSDETTEELLQNLYDSAFLQLSEELKTEMIKIPLNERNPKKILVLTIQFLGGNHAPTKTVMERCGTLCKMGYEVSLYNTREQYSAKGVYPSAICMGGNVIQEYSDQDEMDVSDGYTVPFYQPKISMPNIDEIRKLFAWIRREKPYYILSIGSGSLVADLCNALVPVFPMALAFSTLPVTNCHWKILGRERTEKERREDGDAPIIESRFTFRLRPKHHTFTRKEWGIPETAFCMIVVGIRLDSEVTDSFCHMLEQVLAITGHVVFAGQFLQYDSVCARHPLLKQHSSFIGYCEDIPALMQICDLYVNPDRLGGGFSVIEAFSERVPGVYLNRGDVYSAGGPMFCVTDYKEMKEEILLYARDHAYYEEMARQAYCRAVQMTDSVEAMTQLDEKIGKVILSERL